MTGGHRFDPSILREYDIRGKVGESLGEADAYALGRAFASYAARKGARRMALGFDGRLSSPMLAEALSAGLRASGLEVWRIECGPTPMLYYAAYTLPVDGGLMVTGSHNPPEYNGVKMVLQKKSVFGEEIQALGRIAAEGDWISGEGTEKTLRVMEPYVERLLADFAGEENLTVAWDAGNGAAGEAMRRVAERLPGRHILLNAELDGTFPNHHPDPTVAKNLEQLQDAVKRERADLGLAFDGDGDRLGAVDEDGGILYGDQIMLLLAREVLLDNPGSPVIADVKSSQILFDGIAAAGGRPVMWKTGHSLIKAKMLELGAPFAGEMSAHLFFNDRYYGYDDGLYAALRLLTALKRLGTSLKAFRESLPRLHNTPEIRLACSEERKFAVVREVAERLRAEGADVLAIDGVRVKRNGGWWLLRASNTQDVLVARCEAGSAEGLAALKEEVAAQLALSGLAAEGL